MLECALTRLSINKATDHDFAFNSMAEHVEKLAGHLVKAAACHPRTRGKELAVVLRDPVGIATELNALRLRRHELAKEEIEKPENAHPLNSSNALTGLKQVMLDANLARSFDTVSPVMSEGAFQDVMHVKPNPRGWPADTRWVPLEPTKDNQVLYGPGMGRVIFPDHDARAREWAKRQTEATWSKMADKYSEPQRAQWIAGFEANMKTRHYEPLAKYEADWRAAAEDAGTLAYFKEHFDPADPNDPRKHHSPGCVYARESQLIHAPAPVTSGPLLDTYLAMLDKPITDDTAVVLRALVGNQQSVIDIVHTQLTGDSGAEGMRDKTYDFLKGLSSESAVLKKYSWLGDALAMFSVGQLTALSGAALGMAGRSPSIAPHLTRTLGKLQNLWAVQQALELVTQAALGGNAPRVPVLISMKVGVDEALAVLRARKGQHLGVTRSQVKKMQGSGGKIKLSLLTDTDSLRAAQGNVNALLKDPNAGSVSMKGAAGSAAAAAAGSAVVLTEEQFLKLYAQQSQLGAKGAQAVRQTLANSAADVRAITMHLDGRLAIGSVIVQGIGLVNGMQALADAKTRQDVRDAWYGIYDSTAGTMGGLLEMWAVVVTSRTVAQVGEALAGRSMGLAALRFAGNIAGAAGGVINAVAALVKAKDQGTAGNADIASLLKLSGYMFAGTAATSTALGFGAAADWIIARQVGGVVVRQVATGIAARVGAEGALVVIGGTTITASGLGLVLLGAGIVCQVGAILLTPTPMQKWASRSYFGTGGDKFPKGDWKAEHEGLMEALKSGTQEGRKDDVPQKAQVNNTPQNSTYTAMGDWAAP